MRAVVMTMVLVLVAAAGQADETTAPPAQPKCQKAEFNPVTGHVLCLNPLGAPVEALWERDLSLAFGAASGQWTWSPNCTPVPEGM